VRILLILMWFH